MFCYVKPIKGPAGPRTKDQGPGTKDQGPGTKDQGPGSKDQGRRWVVGHINVYKTDINLLTTIAKYDKTIAKHGNT